MKCKSQQDTVAMPAKPALGKVNHDLKVTASLNYVERLCLKQNKAKQNKCKYFPMTQRLRDVIHPDLSVTPSCLTASCL